jgi:hypothetical protein
MVALYCVSCQSLIPVPQLTSQVIVGHNSASGSFRPFAEMEFRPFRDAGNATNDFALSIQVSQLPYPRTQQEKLISRMCYMEWRKLSTRNYWTLAPLSPSPTASLRPSGKSASIHRDYQADKQKWRPKCPRPIRPVRLTRRQALGHGRVGKKETYSSKSQGLGDRAGDGAKQPEKQVPESRLQMRYEGVQGRKGRSRRQAE